MNQPRPLGVCLYSVVCRLTHSTCVAVEWMSTTVEPRGTSGGIETTRAETGSASRLDCLFLYTCVHAVALLYLAQCNTVNFSRRRFCMTCDCTRTGNSLHHTVTHLLSFDWGGVESLNHLVLFAPIFWGHLFNPRCACAARVTVVVMCVCLSVCPSVCPRAISLVEPSIAPQTIPRIQRQIKVK